jgi:predicted component of type VI protein secretion system
VTQPLAAVRREIGADPAEWDVMAAVAALATAARAAGSADPLSPSEPVAVLLGGARSNLHPTADLSGIDAEAVPDRPASTLLNLAHFGLVGPAGALPPSVAARFVRALAGSRERPARRLLDLLEIPLGRLLALAEARADPVLARLLRPGPQADPIHRVLMAMAGETARGDLRRLDPLAVWSGRTVTAGGLETTLRMALAADDLDVRLHELSGALLAASPEERSRLGGRHARLGDDAILGGLTFAPSAGLRVHVAAGGRPLTHDRALDLQPGAPLHRRLAATGRRALGPACRLVLRIDVSAASIRPAVLAGAGATDARSRARLDGMTLLPHRRPPPADAVVPVAIAISA